MAGWRHPVGRELDEAGAKDARRSDVRQCFAHRHACRGGGIEQRDGRSLAHRHGLAAVALEATGGDGRVGHRNLPGSHHRVAHAQAADGAVSDRDQERLVAHARELQDASRGLADLDLVAVQGQRCERQPLDVSSHLRRLAEKYLQGQVDGQVAEVGVRDRQCPLLAGLAQQGERAALAIAERLEGGEGFRIDRDDVALLALVAPEFQGRHAGLVVGNLAQLEARPPFAVVDEFGQSVREPAGPHVVDREDRVLAAEGRASVDHLLAAALHLGVFALHRGEVEVFLARAGRHRGGGAAPQPDQHGGAAEHADARAGRNLRLLDQAGSDVAQSARQHDRLVVAPHFEAGGAGKFFLEGAEVAAQGGASVLVVEGRRTDRSLEHDLEGRGDAGRSAVVGFPGLLGRGDPQVRNAEAGESCLGLRAAARGALVADLATRARGGARVGRDRRRVVVGLHLHQDVDRFGVRLVHPVLGLREEARGVASSHHRRVVVVGREHSVGRSIHRVADHVEQPLGLGFSVDDPVGAEDLVAAVLGVRLGEHHQLDVARVASQFPEAGGQVLDLVGGQGQAERCVCLQQGISTAPENVDGFRGCRFGPREELPRVLEPVQDGLGHAVMEQGLPGLPGGPQRLRGSGQAIGDAAFETRDGGQAAAVGDVGCLRGPGRNRPEPRYHQYEQRSGLFGFRCRPAPGPVLQQALEGGVFRSG